jgi:alpha-glucosidase
VGVAQARVAAMLLLTLRGTPTMYYGDEIGMQDVPIPADQVRDPFEKNVPGLGLGRDPERTPMQWSGDEHAGFSKGNPWLPIANNYYTVNVARECDQPSSILTLHHRLIELRRAEPALSVGEFAPLPATDDLIAYVRKLNERRLLIVLNLSARAQSFSLSELQCRGSLLLTTHLDHDQEEVLDKVELRPDEGLIIELL